MLTEEMPNEANNNIPQDREATVNAISGHIEAILRLMGEDPTREGLVKTPRRAAKALLDNTCGYSGSARDLISSAVFEHSGSDVVIVKNIEFYSLCEHHILPFYGHVSIGYIPQGHIVGLSKLARVVDVYARRLQVQERLTAQVCDAVYEHLGASGVIVVCEASHLCMKMRGVEKQDSTTVTMQYRGAFEDVSLRREFLDMIARK